VDQLEILERAVFLFRRNGPEFSASGLAVVNDTAGIMISGKGDKMIEIKKIPPGKAIGYERNYDKKCNPIYTTGELRTLDNDA
jgi:hypothetical protein